VQIFGEKMRLVIVILYSEARA